MTTFRESIRRRGRETIPFHEHDGSDISGEIVASVIKVIQLLGGTITGEEIIIAGGVNGIIRSDNFVAGSAGWRWRGDGSMEAQDGIFRGVLNADDITAGTLTTSRLILGSKDNLVENPGFETGVKHPASSEGLGGGTGWTTPNSITNSRSGAFYLQYDAAGQTSDAHFHPMGALIDDNPAMTEGDEVYFSVFARRGTGTRQVAAQIVWRTETGAFISSATTGFVATSTAWTKFEIQGVAPANTAFCNFRILFDTTGSAGTMRVDDLYARRKIGTLIIEDQAVDIVRMLDPVFQSGGNADSLNVTITTTETEHVTKTVTLASWVGEVNSFVVGTLQVTETGVRLYTLLPEIAGTKGKSSQQGMDGTTAVQTDTFTVTQHRLLTAPGSSVKFALRSKLSSSTNASNQHELAAILTGIR